MQLLTEDLHIFNAAVAGELFLLLNANDLFQNENLRELYNT